MGQRADSAHIPREAMETWDEIVTKQLLEARCNVDLQVQDGESALYIVFRCTRPKRSEFNLAVRLHRRMFRMLHRRMPRTLGILLCCLEGR